MMNFISSQPRARKYLYLENCFCDTRGFPGEGPPKSAPSPIREEGSARRPTQRRRPPQLSLQSFTTASRQGAPKTSPCLATHVETSSRRHSVSMSRQPFVRDPPDRHPRPGGTTDVATPIVLQLLQQITNILSITIFYPRPIGGSEI